MDFLLKGFSLQSNFIDEDEDGGEGGGRSLTTDISGNPFLYPRTY